jgi:hypothetical protein
MRSVGERDIHGFRIEAPPPAPVFGNVTRADAEALGEVASPARF